MVSEAAWLASITSVPRPVAVSTPLVIVPVPVLDGSMVKMTGLPEAPPVAARVNVEP